MFAFVKNSQLLKAMPVAIVAMMLLSGCSSSTAMKEDINERQTAGVYDPLEPVNRAVFEFNDRVDTFVLNPVASGYKTVVPEPGRKAVTNFLRNLASPVDLFNQVLQADMKGAADTTARFLLNSTFGLAGLIDVAGEAADIPYESEDFGQTMAVWGVPDGPYLVWPILGPSNVRDSAGRVADSASQPLNWYVNREDKEWIQYTRAGLTVLDTKARLMDPMKELKRSSLDYYAAVRSVYNQFRTAQIKDSSGGDVMGGGADSGDQAEQGASAYDDLDMPSYDEFE